jgi:hypothetical protein
MVAVEGQILRGVAGTKGVSRRTGLERRLDQFGSGADNHPLAVNGRAVGFPNLQRSFGGKTNANLFDDPKGGVVNLLDFLRGENFEPQFRVGDGMNGSRHKGVRREEESGKE